MSTMSGFKPMLAAKYVESKLRFPLFASPKLDGIRAIITDKVLSRTLKPIPNKHVQKLFSNLRLAGLDGELIVGSPTSPSCYRDTSSGVMAHDGQPDVTFYVFDVLGMNTSPFGERLSIVRDRLKGSAFGPKIVHHQHQLIHNLAQLLAYEQECLEAGYEGLILRSIDGKYKHGRSTVNEGWMLKMKRFEDSEAIILDFIEELSNNNEKTKDERGYSKRSSHKENKTGKDRLGSIQVRDLKTDVVFHISTGFDDTDRAEIWANKEKYKGKIVKYSYFPVGIKDLPRHSKYLGLRDRRDI